VAGDLDALRVWLALRQTAAATGQQQPATGQGTTRSWSPMNAHVELLGLRMKFWKYDINVRKKCDHLLR